MRFAGRIALTTGLGIVALASAAWAADPAKLEQALPAIQKQFASGRRDDRLAAIERLRGFATADATRVIIDRGLRDRDARVRTAAYEALSSQLAQEPIRTLVFDTLQKEWRRRPPSPLAPALFSALLSSEMQTTDREWSCFWNGWREAPGDGLLPLDKVVETANRTDRSAIATLAAMARSKTIAPEFAVRRALVQALTRLHRAEAIEPLVALLGELDDESRSDIIRYLSELSGEEHGLDAAAWRGWWVRAKDAFAFPESAIRRQLAPVTAPEGMPSYYGLPIYSTRLVFVLDTSQSMSGRKLEAAKRELRQTLDRLPEGAHFGIIAYNSTVTVWEKSLVPLSSATRAAAGKFIEEQQATGTTSSFDALESALGFDAEAIFFLSDGDPSSGKITAPADILPAIAKLNRTRLVSIYSIGIDVGPPGTKFEQFMRALADQNHGTYRRTP